MKKKYRKAICYSLLVILLLVASPLLAIAFIGECATWIGERTIIPIQERLIQKFNIRDNDPD